MNITGFLGEIKCLVKTVRKIGCLFGQLKESNVNQVVNTGKGIEVDLYTVDQETLLGASCGKGRKVYQMFLYNWKMILKRGGGGSKAVEGIEPTTIRLKGESPVH